MPAWSDGNANLTDRELALRVAAQEDAKQDASDNGGSIAAVAYRLASDGTTVTAYDKAGTSVSSGTDGGAVLAAVLALLPTAGGTVEFRNEGNVFPWGSVPGIAPGITNKLLIKGNGSYIQLSAGGPRFLDLVKVADYDTFQHIEVTDFVVDCNNIDTSGHVIFGTLTAASSPEKRINIEDVKLRRLKAINVPTTATGRKGIRLGTSQVAGGEATQNTIKNVTIEDVQVDGGQYGIMVTGGPSGAITNLNILIDEIHISRFRHTRSDGAIPSVGTAGILIGMNGPVGHVTIDRAYVELSADVGIEIDNASHAEITNSKTFNCKYGFFVTNFATPAYGVSGQTVAFRRCHNVVTNASVANGNSAFRDNLNNALAFGTLILDECSHYQNNNGVTNGTQTGPTFYSRGGALTMRELDVLDCRYLFDTIAFNNASSATFRSLDLSSGSIATVRVRNFDSAIAGAISAAGVIAFSSFAVGGGGTFTFDIDGLTHDANITGSNFAGASAVALATNAVTAGGRIRKLKIVTQTGDGAGKAVRALTNLTVQNAPILIEDCDFTNVGATEVQVDGTVNSTGPILCRGNRWKTKPAPVALTGLVTATGKVLGAQAATVFWPCVVQLTQGSGAAVTAVDYSTNGGTTYTNLLTQASAALPSGNGPQIGLLTPADLVKATFTTTQPTVTLVPVNP